MSHRPTAYDLLDGDFDLSSDLKQEAPPYVPTAPPTYKLRAVRKLRHLSLAPSIFTLIMVSPQHVPRGLRLRPIDDRHSPSIGPNDARLSGLDLAESIWSQDSDLTLDDLALHSDSASTQSRSSTSSHWSAPPQTPSTSRHLELQPPPTPAPLAVNAQAEEPLPKEPGSPAPAYSRDPLEFDPALLASFDPQLRERPFEAFEDDFWASFPDSAPAEVAPSLPPRSASLSRHHPPTSSASFTHHSTFSDSSSATVLAPPVPPLPPSLHVLPPPAYVASSSKPLPSIPPPSPLRLRPELAQANLPQYNPPWVAASPSPLVEIDDSPPFAAAAAAPTSGDTIKFFPLRAEVRPRSKSVGGGTRTVRRFTHAIARLRGRD
ncbi:hypothetical protein BC827DRAFT_853433 [Russula dissimulans]|nr:hypothetical protein BC827DRAFT_853433 [Russula dissimulans]